MKENTKIAIIEILTYALIIFNINVFSNILVKSIGLTYEISINTSMAMYLIFIVLLYAGNYFQKGKLIFNKDRSQSLTDRLTALFFFGLFYLVGYLLLNFMTFSVS